MSRAFLDLEGTEGLGGGREITAGVSSYSAINGNNVPTTIVEPVERSLLVFMTSSVIADCQFKSGTRSRRRFISLLCVAD
jgi:hypothetical protein